MHTTRYILYIIFLSKDHNYDPFIGSYIPYGVLYAYIILYVLVYGGKRRPNQA